MPEPTLTITISQAGDDLVLSGTPGVGDYGIIEYTEPASMAQSVYGADSPYTHGSEALAGRWVQAVLSFDWCPDTAEDEADVATTKAAVAAAIGQFKFTVITQVSDAAAEAWSADMGSIIPSPRTFTNLTHHNPVYRVTIPVHPVPGA